MKKWGILLVVLLSFLLSSSEALAMATPNPAQFLKWVDDSASTVNQYAQGNVSSGTAYWKVMAKAEPDECYYGVGSTSNQYPMTDPATCTGTFKRNDGYIWGMTQFKDNIFFGTAGNVACLVAENYLLYSTAYVDPDFVCEMSNSAYSYHDDRFPNLYMYTMAGGLQKLVIPSWAEIYRMPTIGFRAAGVHPSGIVLLAGPMAAKYGSGINMFAFNGTTGAFLGATNVQFAQNIRNIYTTSSGTVYFGVGSADQVSTAAVGQVYKWNVNATAVASGDMTTLFSFELVGTGLDGEAAGIAEHEGRLFVGSWPDNNNSASYGGLWMSPTLPLTAASATGWKKLMSYDKYDPDQLAAKLYGTGALKSFGGYLYWGTMSVPGMNYYYFTQKYGGPSTSNSNALLLLANSTNRPLSLFRGKNFGTSSQKIDLLYGGENGGYFFDYNGGAYSSGGSGSDLFGLLSIYNAWKRSWSTKKNLMNLTPLYGEGGFNNKYANYCWSMAIYNNHLYVGTMDYSEISQTFLGMVPYWATFGADLYRFNNTTSGAVKISDNGMGNPNQYGIRTMAVTSDALILGTAGGANMVPGGGWELIRLKETSWSGGYVYSGPYRMEAENAALTGFQVTSDTSASEDKVVSNTSTSCSVALTFAGNSGYYDIAIRYYDPGWKSKSVMKFYVSGALIGSKTLNQSKGWYFWHINNVLLSPTNKVQLTTTLDRNTRNAFKLDFIDIVPH